MWLRPCTQMHAWGRYSTVITAIICIGRYLKTKSNGNINSSAVARIWLTRTLFVPVHTANQKTNQTNEIQCIFIIVSIDSSIRQRHWTNNGVEQRKVKIEYVRDDIDNNNKNKYYEGLNDNEWKKNKKKAIEWKSVRSFKHSQVESNWLTVE